MMVSRIRINAVQPTQATVMILIYRGVPPEMTITLPGNDQVAIVTGADGMVTTVIAGPNIGFERTMELIFRESAHKFSFTLRSAREVYDLGGRVDGDWLVGQIKLFVGNVERNLPGHLMPQEPPRPQRPAARPDTRKGGQGQGGGRGDRRNGGRHGGKGQGVRSQGGKPTAPPASARVGRHGEGSVQDQEPVRTFTLGERLTAIGIPLLEADFVTVVDRAKQPQPPATKPADSKGKPTAAPPSASFVRKPRLTMQVTVPQEVLDAQSFLATADPDMVVAAKLVLGFGPTDHIPHNRLPAVVDTVKMLLGE